MDRKRKRGGQPGNLNALKHGFYAGGMTRDEVKGLARIGEGLMDEINLLRVIIRRVAELANQVEQKEELLGLLDTLGSAGVRLGSMLRTQRVYFERDPDEELRRMVTIGLAEAVEEWRDLDDQ
ncbi:MAG: hypothetical protein KBG60_03340 [Anaerolineaceae bacterium]|nr:hypothetical protein [Anaerolineaceae bacterium]